QGDARTDLENRWKIEDALITSQEITGTRTGRGGSRAGSSFRQAVSISSLPSKTEDHGVPIAAERRRGCKRNFGEYRKLEDSRYASQAKFPIARGRADAVRLHVGLERIHRAANSVCSLPLLGGWGVG